MEKLKLITVTITLMVTVSLTCHAQEYRMAGGLRLGYPVSLSLKLFLNESSAVEAYLGTRGYDYIVYDYRSTVLGGAYLIHKPLDIDGLDGLKWYFGGGAALYFWSYDEGIFDDDRVDTSLALQGYVGLDYSFANTPINISLDWTPTILLRGLGSGFGGDYGSLGVRYIISR
ncbi:MAG: hypothetical protein AAFZ15_13705 [Bacteroidota bacterium]